MRMIEQTKSTFLLKLIRNCIAENPNSPRIYTRSSLSTAHNSWLDLSKFSRKRFSFNTLHSYTPTYKRYKKHHENFKPWTK